MKLIFPAKELLQANDYRNFLTILYQKNKSSDRGFSYAYLAQKCHFSSKSFLKEVMAGKKETFA